jgi:hypothetical protein
MAPNTWKSWDVCVVASTSSSGSGGAEWLGESVHKRSTSVHVIVIPRLLTALWRKQLGKVTDLMLTAVPLGCPAWQADNLEPLILAISLPLSKSFPWRFRNTPATHDVECRVPPMWTTSFDDIGPALRKLLLQARNVPKCEGAWCPSCYTVALKDDVFPIKRPVSLEDEDAVINAKDYDRFVVARARFWRKETARNRRKQVLFPALFAVAAYAGGLRGEEVPLMDLFSTFKHFSEGVNHPKHPHVVMALCGRFKNKIGELEHLQPLATKTRLGLGVLIWFQQMLSWHKRKNVTRGPVF